jgi:hypothetical protein
MSDTTKLEFQNLPTLASGYRRALFGRKKGLRDGDTLPRFEASTRGIRLEPLRIAAYATVCGFAPDGTVPITYPHVLAAPLHLAILTHPRFPVSALGIIHARNIITQHEALDPAVPLDLDVWIEGHRRIRSGMEFDVMTTFSVGGRIVWESVTAVFVRARKREDLPKGAESPEPPPPARTEEWTLPPNQGRLYAKVSGDYNLIHLYPLTAKLFGFPRPIVHGMWSLARSAAAMSSEAPASPSRLEVEFKRPVLLPCKAAFGSAPVEGGVAFLVSKPSDADKRYLTGRWLKA